MKTVFKINQGLFFLFAAIIMLSACERTADPVDPMLNLFTEVTGESQANFRFVISDRIGTRSIVRGKNITWEEGDFISFRLRVISIAWSTLQEFAKSPGGLLPVADYGVIEGKFVYESGSWVTYLYSGDTEIGFRERAAGVVKDNSSFYKTEEVTVDSPGDGYCAVEAKYIYTSGELSDPNCYQLEWNQTLPFDEGTQTVTVQLPYKNR